MTELTDLLQRASELDETTRPLGDDLARGRAALRRRRARVVRIGSIAATAVIAAGIVGASTLDRGADAPAVIQDDSAADIQLLAADTDAGPYTFGKLPEGWEVQGVSPSAVTIAPTDAADQEMYSFDGKLVILYDQNAPSGDVTSVDGRDFYSGGDSDTSILAVRTGAGEPAGTVTVQYPEAAGWSQDTMIEFLDAVQVNGSAQPGLG
jgi:hypothetical protein